MKRVFLTWIVGIVFWSAIIFTLEFLSLPLSQPSFINLYAIKDYINSQETNKQRIVVVSGSSTLFGFNGDLINAQTNFTLINYAGGAGSPIETLSDQIMQRAKENDIVFMPLEFVYYTRQSSKTDPQYIQNLIAFDSKAIYRLPFHTLLKSLAKSPPTEIPIYLLNKYIFEKEQDPIQTMQALWQQTPNFYGYNYKSLDKYGDYAHAKGSFVNDNTPYLDLHLKPSLHFISEYNRLLEFAASKNIKIFLTYPPTMENPDFSLKDPQTFAKIENLKAELKKHNIEIYGDFRDFHFERKYFFDTHYHLNEEGAILRTQAFIKLLEDMQQEGLIP